MDFELPEELRMFKASLRRFVDNELIPIERQTVTAKLLGREHEVRGVVERNRAVRLELTELLVDRFGDVFNDYKRSTPAYIPFLLIH